ncbi:cathepsin K-like [Battus philenor]|uniref:cathepsin K-like n=1 Tax=Battus philenor TaxID=42288 RepID=UPI0035D059ED
MASRTSAVLFKLITVSFFCGILNHVIVNREFKKLQWPTEYHYKAERINLKTGMKEPFEVWYGGEQNRSRIDYYNGTVKRFYHFEPTEDTATVYQINPETTDQETNEIVCRKMEDEEIVKYLPQADELIYIGQRLYDGKTVQVWKYEENDELSYKTQRTVYAYANGDDSIPVRSEIVKYKSWNGGLDSHVITNFYFFEATVGSIELDAEHVEECTYLGKLGENFKVDVRFLHPSCPNDVNKAFHSYKRHYNKKHSKAEHEIRKDIFEKNWRRVIEHNKRNAGYKLEINKFADQSEEELSYLTATRPSGPEEKGTMDFPYTDEELKAIEDELPLNYDMRIDGVISHVKNQGACGSCWAFSSTAAVEGALARSNGGKVYDLSEQSLIDCAWESNNGCNGGDLAGTFKYIVNHGIPSEWAYGPYLEQDGFCHLENMTKINYVKGFARVPALSEVALKAALYKYGPVTVSIYATDNMKLYSSGVYYDLDCTENEANHGVTVVGYGQRDDVNYWIVKNSWGEDWGEDGYILMSSVNNNCNLMSDAYYPII